MIVGYILAIVIGATLGLLGGGGSILAVPVFVYLFGIDPATATGYSLFVVGVSAAAGSVQHMRNGYLDYRTAFVFAVPSLAAVFASRRFILPSIPETVFTIGSVDLNADFLLILFLIVLLVSLLLFTKSDKDRRLLKIIIVVAPAVIIIYLMRRFVIPSAPDTLISLNGFTLEKGTAIMILFSLVMLSSAFSMIRKKDPIRWEDEEMKKHNYLLMMLQGAAVGVISGIVGAGGGFLIVPALVLMAKLPMKLAVGTSLLVVAVQSLIGFTGDIGARDIDWPFLLVFAGLAILGIAAGGYAARFISGDRLKSGFGWFVLVMAVLVLTKELIL